MNDNQNNSSSKKIPSSAAIREVLHQTALKAPSQSGVYLWRNENDTVIYVGKAKNLHNRLSSYFSGIKDIKTRLLISHATRIEYITTNNEYEAFLLENNLIKKYTPKYNINLKDGKSYPVLRITKEKFPKIFKTRRVIQDGSTYFGPFPDSTALDTFIETIYEIYPLRHCKLFKTKATPCMYYHIGRCLGPCCKNIAESTYTEFIDEIKSLLEGKGQETTKKLEAEMKAAAKALNFEKAARLRDGIKALSVLQNQNIVESFDDNDRDYIAFWREDELISFTVLKIRSGKLLGRDNYRTISLNENSEVLPEFITAYYEDGQDIPEKIYVYGNGMAIAGTGNNINSNTSPSADFLEQIENDLLTQDTIESLHKWFEEVIKRKIRIIRITGRSKDSKLHLAALDMARQNAHEDIIRALRERGDFPAMEELQKVLGLPKLPVRIEGFDIAHIGGKFPVASLISFYNGNPDKKNYRYFRLKTTDGYIDDFQSMREATTRRYSRLSNENKELPDLILIDGGIGQVNAVDGVLKALGLNIPIAGLAKRDEEIWRPYATGPVCLPKRSAALHLLQRVRDETHRFATSRNQELRTKENTISPFTKLPGVGEVKDKLLMKKYGTLYKLTQASESEIAQLLSLRAEAASTLLLAAKELYRKQKETKEKQKLSLGIAGTTKEKAAHHQKLSNLAALALDDSEDDGTLLVADENQV